MDKQALLSRITVNPKIFGGKPIVRGHRLAVEHIMQMLAAGDTGESLLKRPIHGLNRQTSKPASYSKKNSRERKFTINVRVLLDTCVAPRIKDQLEAAGHDVVWIGYESDPGDEAILGRAYREQRVLVTLDKDFGTLSVLHGKPHCGIIRMAGVSSAQQGLVCLQALADHAEDLQAGAIITVSQHRLRKRPPKR